MAILSITFHTEDRKSQEWDAYLQKKLIPQIENLGQNFLFSEVINEMISEGKNTNLLLFFDKKEERDFFLDNNFQAISEPILSHFQDSVLIFKTHLNRIKSN